MLIITRAGFRNLAKTRLDEAQLLLNQRKYSGAYYLSGYVVECGLKACIAKTFKLFHYPDLEFVRSCYTHDLRKLVSVAGLQTNLDSTKAADRQFEVYWGVVANWREHSRYLTKRRNEAVDMLEAVSDRAHGVLQWIEQHW